MTALPSDAGQNTFMCPHTHPYVFLGAFTDVPAWEDHSRSLNGGWGVWGAAQSVAQTRPDAERLNRSYAEGQGGQLGWVRFSWSMFQYDLAPDAPPAAPQWAATYECAQRKRTDVIV